MSVDMSSRPPTRDRPSSMHSASGDLIDSRPATSDTSRTAAERSEPEHTPPRLPRLPRAHTASPSYASPLGHARACRLRGVFEDAVLDVDDLARLAAGVFAARNPRRHSREWCGAMRRWNLDQEEAVSLQVALTRLKVCPPFIFSAIESDSVGGDRPHSRTAERRTEGSVCTGVALSLTVCFLADDCGRAARDHRGWSRA